MNFQNNLKNAALASGNLNPVRTNGPKQYISRQRQYFDPETRAFQQEKAKYAQDFMICEVQGINESDPLGWESYGIRIADVVNPSSAIQRHFDDYKQYLFESARVEYVRPGTKIKAMGSTWIVTNPQNISGSSGSGIMRRCNAVWNYLDYYGNVISEPIIVENERANASTPDSQESLLIAKGYFNVICQYNDFTRQIDTNTRLILGTGAYKVTGYSDFHTEFTGDYSSLRLLYFTIRYEEPNYSIDDMENHVAGGLGSSWNIEIEGQAKLNAGSEAQFTASLIKNGIETPGTPEFPISFLWKSSDESVIGIAPDGTATAYAEGTATITATLYQNQNVSQTFEVTVSAVQDGVEFTSTVPQKLGYGDSVTITAAYFENGAETESEILWSFEGADKTAYSAAAEGNSATIKCFGYSDTPLVINASYGDYSASESIILEGF